MTDKVEDNDLKSEYKVMINNSAVYKYEIPFKGPFLIMQCVDQWKGHITVWSDKK